MVECDEETSANLMSAAKNFRLQFKSDSSQRLVVILIR